ncbi:hypothetical protein B0T17DRAFT_517867 [Bombardia bombarda]|uniref:Secreted protein n=1 Tax=Bombardia bombarda TaxID=252184 RepID=A0AA39XLX0_9PEZI|nr:hypothetical protein B0T17DRAFT_517867 [Bombardia bombarda]
MSSCIYNFTSSSLLLTLTAALLLVVEEATTQVQAFTPEEGKIRMQKMQHAAALVHCPTQDLSNRVFVEQYWYILVIVDANSKCIPRFSVQVACDAQVQGCESVVGYLNAQVTRTRHSRPAGMPHFGKS